MASGASAPGKKSSPGTLDAILFTDFWLQFALKPKFSDRSNKSHWFSICPNSSCKILSHYFQIL